MRKVKFVSVFVLLALLLSAAAVQAQVTPPSDSGPVDLPGLDAPVSEWTDADLERLVDLIVSDEITIPQSEIVYDRLTEDQVKRVAELLGARAGVPLEEVRQAMAERQESVSVPCTMSSRGSYFWGCYPCEHLKDIDNQTLPDYHFESKECSSNDEDWIFDYEIDFGQNPDSLRWRTDSTQVWWAISICYLDKKLNSFAYDWEGWEDANLVVGKTCVRLGGGVDEFDDHLILGQK